MAKQPTIAALMIGRGGSSMVDKNIRPVLGVPLLQWAAAAAVRSAYIGRYYVSSDCDRILSTAAQAGYTPIRRPAELALPTAQSTDAVQHALPLIEADGPVDIVVVQHANVGTISEKIIDACIEQLLADPTLSAVIPSHEKPEYHPFRARFVEPDGTLRPAISGDSAVSGNRQDLPKCLFYDHSIWVLSVERGIRSTDGQAPWTCMGSRIKPFETVGCMDVHSEEDIALTQQWIRENDIPTPNFAG